MLIHQSHRHFIDTYRNKLSFAALSCSIAALSGCSEAPEDGSFGTRSQALLQMRVEAENYDRFFDSDSVHQGNCGTGPVDAEWTSDPNGGQCNIGWTAAGEWLEYDVDLAESGSYDFIFRVASASTGQSLHLEVDGVDVSGPVTSPGAGWQAFEDRLVSDVELSAGPHVLRVVFDTGLLNLNYFDLDQTSESQQIILSADFDSGMNGFNYYDRSGYEYADGGHATDALSMTLGGEDAETVFDMSGAFQRLFWISNYQEVTLSFDYTLEQSCYYETDESSELRVEVDQVELMTNNLPYVARITGNGSNCPGVSTSGTFSQTFALSPGKHNLEIVGINDKKSYADEFTTLRIDNVSITASSAQCTAPLSQSFENLCNACGGLLDCAGDCTQSFPTDIGTPCGVCGGVIDCDGSCTKPLNAPCGAPISAQERHAACAKDPRVVAGLVQRDVCTGADIFFRETFEGNGRTCGSCHPVANNYTIDPPFISDLLAEDPSNPLFVAQQVSLLENLETDDLINHGMILENVDGFQDPEHRFVSRSVPHLFSLAITLAADPADGSTTPPMERTGWGGDGAPGDGSLNAFLDGAINQHFPKSLERVSGVDFREATQFERDVVESFQLALGRLNELDLDAVSFTSQGAENGKVNFQDTQGGRCGICHANAGANFINSGLNRGFDNGIGDFGTPGRLVDFFGPGSDLILGDGGFGGADLSSPNIDTNGIGFENGFGDGNFSVPPLVEAADTAPFFHSNKPVGSPFLTTMGKVMFFYGTDFQFSSGADFVESEFGPGLIDSGNTNGIAAMLVVLNAVFNIDIARQRLSAAETLATDLHDIRSDIQAELMLLAGEEIEDAIRVLEDEGLHASERTTLQAVLNVVLTADENDPWDVRRADVQSALSSLDSVRALFGSNFNYQLGSGTLMY